MKFRDPASRIAFPGVVTNEGGRVTGAEYFSQVKNVEGFQVLQVVLPAAPANASSSACNVTAPEQSLPIDPNGVVYRRNCCEFRMPLRWYLVKLRPRVLPKQSCFMHTTMGNRWIQNNGYPRHSSRW